MGDEQAVTAVSTKGSTNCFLFATNITYEFGECVSRLHLNEKDAVVCVK